MNGYLEENKILTEHQSGFRNKHSCTTAILKLTEDMHQSIARGKCIVLVLLDFANAFGSVDHDTLIQILKGVGVRDMSIEWFKSFLSGWQQNVKHGEKISKSQTINRGIIQGENNSQMLFSLFINELVSYIKFTRIIMFADDVQIYLESDVPHVTDAIDTVNAELQNIIKYGIDYGIKINPSKTKAIILSSKNNLHKLDYNKLPNIVVDGEKIEYVTEVRDLGYQLNRTLTNESHRGTISKKVYGALNSIRPLKYFLPVKIRLLLINTLVLPIIDYMDVVYHDFDVHGTKGESDKLEKLLNMCIRYVLNVKKHEHITPHRKELNMMTLFNRRSLHVANTIHKILNKGAPKYLNDIVDINARNVRSSNKLMIRKPTNNFQKTSMYIGGPKLWNELPDKLRIINDNKNFEKEMREYLKDKE